MSVVDFFLAMKVSDKKSHRAMKIATHSIGKRNVCLVATLYHLNKIQRTTFLRNADEKLIRCICVCVFNTKVTSRSNDVKKSINEIQKGSVPRRCKTW